jgi:hypothetical protein
MKKGRERGAIFFLSFFILTHPFGHKILLTWQTFLSRWWWSQEKNTQKSS